MGFQGSVQGSFHQGSMKTWYHGGAQCTIMAVTAFLFGAFMLHPCQWERRDVDSILIEGDRLYNNIVDSLFEGNRGHHLLHSEVPALLAVWGEHFNLQPIHTWYGAILSTQETNSRDYISAGGVSLQHAFAMSFAVSKTVLITVGSYTIGVFASDNGVFVFDSHARDSFGQVDPEGMAVLLHFSTVADVVQHIFRNHYGQEFNVSPFSIQNAHSTTRIDDVFDGLVTINPAAAPDIATVCQPAPRPLLKQDVQCGVLNNDSNSHTSPTFVSNIQHDSSNPADHMAHSDMHCGLPNNASMLPTCIDGNSSAPTFSHHIADHTYGCNNIGSQFNHCKLCTFLDFNRVPTINFYDNAVKPQTHLQDIHKACSVPSGDPEQDHTVQLLNMSMTGIQNHFNSTEDTLVKTNLTRSATDNESHSHICACQVIIRLNCYTCRHAWYISTLLPSYISSRYSPTCWCRLLIYDDSGSISQY